MFVISGVIVVVFNFWFLPNGYHLSLGVRNAPTGELDIFTILTTRRTSFMLAKYDTNKCDADIFHDGTLSTGKNQAINTLIFLYNLPDNDNKLILDLLKDRLRVCDVNDTGKFDASKFDRAPNDMTPLQNSIILKYPLIVRLLLDAGAKTDLRMPVREKKTDNMNALELATLMTTGKLNEEKMRAAAEILTLLQEHEKKQKSSER